MLISVIIPHYRRYELLMRCLNGLRQQHDPDFELIVVDDGSQEDPPAELQALIDHWPRLRWIGLPGNRGRAAARNTGVAAACGELLIFLDCDMDVGPDFVAAHRRYHLTQGPRRIGQGRIIGTQDAQARPTPSLWTDASRARFATGNVSVERAIVAALGGFDESFGAYGFEDLELGYRLERAGWRSGPVSEAVSWHYEPLPAGFDWEADIAKEQARGEGAARFYRKHPSLEVRLIAQLTPLHGLLDQLMAGLGSEAAWKQRIERIQTRSPKLALALYRALLNHYCLQATRQAMQQPEGMPRGE